MELNINRTLVFVDIETTGISIANDRIVEISMLKIYPDGKEEIKTFRINPTIPIPPKTSEIHGIYDEDVKNEPVFADLADEIALFLKDFDLAGYNSNKFDFPLLAEEFLRAKVDFDLKNRKFIDVQVIFHKMEQRTLIAAYKFYCNKDLTDAHSAKADVCATYEILKSQLNRYSKLENNIDFLNEFSSHSKNVDYSGRIIYNDEDVEVFNFGKHKGKPVKDIFKKEPGYYSWMMKGDFSLFTKKVITEIYRREL